MILVVTCFLFSFLGMYIGEKYDLKKASIYIIFGIFTINILCSMFPIAYELLYRNYHGSTWLYISLSILVGYLLIKLINYKYEDSDNLSIVGFIISNSYLLYLHKFSIIFFIINILYFILIGLYIKRSKSWIYVMTGSIIGIIFNYINAWGIGFVLSINIGFVLYYILSIYNIIFRCSNKKYYFCLIIAIIIAFLGGVL